MSLLKVESRSKFPLGATLLALAGIGVACLTFVNGRIGFAVGSIPFLTTAFCFWWARPRAFVAEFSEEAIVLKSSDQVIPYESITYLDFAARCDKTGEYISKPAELLVTHDAGEFSIPANIDHPSVDVYEFLFERFIPRDDFPLDPILEDFVNEQEDLFGPEKVYCFCARKNAAKKKAGRRFFTKLAAGLASGALAWVAAGALLMQEDWYGGALTLGVLAILFFLIGVARRRTPAAGIKNWDLAGVVVSPIGVAMIQGQLKGKMKWDEIKAVSLGMAAKNFEYSSTRSTPGVVLKFDGGALTIVDIYNQPLPYLFSVIQDFWQGGDDA